ncbi:MAG: hypothetical protein MUE39_03580, partial [Gammaproteobacteria bacterium]|nr:hypothetical protein [Gammaproteobacteria bacterium]
AALPVRRTVLIAVTAFVIVALAAAIALRAYQWSGFGRMITAEVEHHPDSLRANFQYGQLLMAQLDKPALRDEAARLAKEHFARVARLDPDNADALFGLVVLELTLDRTPPGPLVEALVARLRQIPFNPLNINSGQFAFLVEWHDGDSPRARLSKEQMLAIFDAALANPTIPSVAQASVYHALRAYHHRVLGDAEAALRYAELAVQAAPSEWEMQDRRIRLLATLGRFDEAEQALREAVVSDTAGVRGARAERLAAVIERARRGEPVPAAPRDETANGAAR